MSVDEEEVSQAKKIILQAASENDWTVDFLPANMSCDRGIIQTRKSELLKTLQDYPVKMEAWNRLLREDYCFRHDNGVVYRATPAGRNALAALEVSSSNLPVKAVQHNIFNFNKDVFVVHGHDELAKEAVCNAIHNAGAKPIVLHDQPNGGKTIIEKLETNSSVGFAVIILTPDDFGYSKSSGPESGRSRARQNVILEMGFFMGKISRGKICVLHKGDTEILSDFSGVVYVPMDDSGAWKYKLKDELRHAGIPE